MAFDGTTWKTMAELRVDMMRKALEPGRLDELPEGERAKIREVIQSQLAALESGGETP